MRDDALHEHAPAKVNLTLRVLGRRPDGYHALESLVTFADVGDLLHVWPHPRAGFQTVGPFAAAIEGDNLVQRAVLAAQAVDPRLQVGLFELHKHLPVASGIGGGSTDAAAALRLLMRLDPRRAPGIDWHAIARGLGADVPVCLAARAALMSGTGEAIALLPPLPPVWCVLVNPGVALSTRDVFRELGAPPIDGRPDCGAPAAGVGARASGLRGVPPTDTAGFFAWVAAGRNDLEPPALRLCPLIADVLDALAAERGTRVARMSGSGATCFGLYAGEDEACAAAAAIAGRHASWWVRSARLS